MKVILQEQDRTPLLLFTRFMSHRVVECTVRLKIWTGFKTLRARFY